MTSAEAKRFLSQSLWDLLSGLAIAVIVHSLDPSLFAHLIVRLIPAYGFGASRLSVQLNVVRLYKVELKDCRAALAFGSAADVGWWNRVQYLKGNVKRKRVRWQDRR